MIDIGRQCAIAEPSSTTVNSWLACKSQRWLLIIDNADNTHIDYSDYMPSSKRGDILLTTRNPECAAYATVGSESLGGLGIDFAKELLLKATRTPEIQWKEKERAALTVIKTLGSHTLAIIQAGAFVWRKRCSLEEYPVIFQQQKKPLLKFHSSANVSTYGDVYKTFEVSAEYLQNSGLPEDLDALNLLHIFAFMHNNETSETLFQRASEYATELQNSGSIDDEEVFSLSVRHIARVPEYMQQGWSSNPQNRSRWREARAILESLSLITVREDHGSIDISMHSLVHAWAKERQDHQNRCMAWQSAATVLALSCEGWYDFCPFFTYLQPHVRACVSHEVDSFIENISDMEAAQLVVQLAYVLYRMKEWSSLSSLVQYTRLRLQDKDGVKKEIREELKTLTAQVYVDKGDYGEAVKMFRDVLEARAQRLAEDDSGRLDSQHNLGDAYQANGQIDEAIELLEHVVKVREKLAEDHPDRLASQHNLADAYQANGQIDEAIELLEHVVEIRREKLAEDHPDRLVSEHNLAIAYQANGQIDEAIELLEYVISIKIEKLAEDHPDRLASQHQLAVTYQANGQIDEAIELLKHVVSVKKEKLAEDNPSRLASQHALTQAYQAKRQVEKG